jgi:hypothetical protein
LPRIIAHWYFFHRRGVMRSSPAERLRRAWDAMLSEGFGSHLHQNRQQTVAFVKTPKRARSHPKIS